MVYQVVIPVLFLTNSSMYQTVDFHTPNVSDQVVMFSIMIACFTAVDISLALMLRHGRGDFGSGGNSCRLAVRGLPV